MHNGGSSWRWKTSVSKSHERLRWVPNPSQIAKGAIQAKGLDKAKEEDSDDGSSATDGDTNDGADDDVDSGFEDDVAMLREYCLIVTDETGDHFEMHGLVQLSTRRWRGAFGLLETFKQQCIERMAASFPTRRYENSATCRSLFAHVQVVLGYWPSEEMVETWAMLLHNGGWYAWSQGRYEVAQQMLAVVKSARFGWNIHTCH